MNRNSAESRSDQPVCKRFVVTAGPYGITGSKILRAHGIGAAVIGLNFDRREALLQDILDDSRRLVKVIGFFGGSGFPAACLDRSHDTSVELAD